MLAQSMLVKNPVDRISSQQLLKSEALMETMQNLSPLLKPLTTPPTKVLSSEFADIEKMLDDEMEELETKHMKEIEAIFKSY